MDHSYTMTQWQDAPSTETPLNADNLNHIEQGIGAIYYEAGLLEQAISQLSDAVSEIAEAQAGTAIFQGAVNSGTDISDLTSYKKGWYWTVATAGTFAGEVCEAGDMIFCVSDYISAYSPNDFSIVQKNIDSLPTPVIEAITNAEIDVIVAS